MMEFSNELTVMLLSVIYLSYFLTPQKKMLRKQVDRSAKGQNLKLLICSEDFDIRCTWRVTNHRPSECITKISQLSQHGAHPWKR